MENGRANLTETNSITPPRRRRNLKHFFNRLCSDEGSKGRVQEPRKLSASINDIHVVEGSTRNRPQSPKSRVTKVFSAISGLLGVSGSFGGASVCECLVPDRDQKVFNYPIFISTVDTEMAHGSLNSRGAGSERYYFNQIICCLKSLSVYLDLSGVLGRGQTPRNHTFCLQVRFPECISFKVYLNTYIYSAASTYLFNFRRYKNKHAFRVS